MLELVVARIKFNRMIVAAAVLAVGSPPTVAADDTSRFRGSGIYRPFNLMRQIKLTTAFFVNPSLPDKVDIAFAHRLSDVMEGLRSKDLADALGTGEMRLAVPVDEASGYLTPIPAPCQLPADSRQASEALGCAAWLDALRAERPDALQDFHVLVDQELSLPGNGRVVTWDPDEVVEGQSDLPRSPEGFRVR